MIEYPRKGIYSLAFVTNPANKEITSLTKKKMINIFLPTTPNPTSGYFLMVPEKDTIPLNITVEAAFKVIISAGIYQELIPDKENNVE